MAFYTPLRYPGGKGKLAYYLKALIEENGLYDGHYVEPFAGGAGVALELMFQEYVRHIHINDLDKAVYSFWLSVVEHTDELCALINDTPVTIEEWERQREIIKDSDNQPPLQLGFATFFLNRTNRSGILKAGVIGGKAQAGKWKLNVRFNKDELINRINRIAMNRDRVHVYNMDTADFLKHKLDSLPQDTLIYLDPPYYIKGQGLYRNFYNHDDHVQIREILDGVTDKPWVVSYDNAPEISEIYSSYRQQVFDLQYTAQTKRVASEIMIYSDKVQIPSIPLGKYSA
ncbi:DNA adenine methylase [Vibrio splendidus]|uniref:DNA adenine methylase n=1 Tax=Vibrio splendidus TaxID=29497 RepID=UPI000D333B3B|nr:DNA adenine methylase [Vibrio splendidus]PTO62226.1 DNA methyltransferase [Vibrio splendidus]